MKESVNFSRFCDAFQMRKENFSYEGKQALFDYLEQLEEDTGEEIELDVISLCCEYTEYDCLEDFQTEYGKEYENLEAIEEQTFVIRIADGKFIIQCF